MNGMATSIGKHIDHVIFNTFDHWSRWDESKTHVYPHYLRRPRRQWAGGDFDDHMVRRVIGNAALGEKMNDLLGHYEDIVVSDLAMDVDFNIHAGLVDPGAKRAGVPERYVGPVETYTDKAPVILMIDPFVTWQVRTTTIERRGAAMLALASTLLMYRPVRMEVVFGRHFTGNSKDMIVRIPVSTTPLDVARAAYMIADPLFLRIGLLALPHLFYDIGGECPGPTIRYGGESYQRKGMFLDVAKSYNITPENTIALPAMFSEDENFINNHSAIEWVKKHIKRLSKLAEDEEAL